MDVGYFIRPGESYEGMLDLARHAEELGLYGAFLNDHVVPLFGNKRLPFLESWTALTGIGLETKRLRVGHITLMNSMRNPAMLAKMISTLENMIGGRYEVILGGGWMRDEYEGYDLMGRGRGVPSPKESCMNSIRTIALRTTIPPSAIIPIIAVAVKNTGFSNEPISSPVSMLSSQKPGMMPMAVSGMAVMITRGIRKEVVWITSRM